MSEDLDGLDPDRVVAAFFSKHPKTLPRWDKSERMKALGWPAPIYINGHKHRQRRAYKAFAASLVQAALNP